MIKRGGNEGRRCNSTSKCRHGERRPLISCECQSCATVKGKWSRLKVTLPSFNGRHQMMKRAKPKHNALYNVVESFFSKWLYLPLGVMERFFWNIFWCTHTHHRWCNPRSFDVLESQTAPSPRQTNRSWSIPDLCLSSTAAWCAP